MVESVLIIRLVVAALLGVLLGLERSLAGKHAGMRTYALVSLGSALFVVVGIMSSYEFSLFVGINPMAIASSVVVGIGFIGAGLAALRGEHPELTTASGLWLSAGIGMAAGFGLYEIAVAGAALGFVVFWLFAKIERKLNMRYGIGHEN